MNRVTPVKCLQLRARSRFRRYTPGTEVPLSRSKLSSPEVGKATFEGLEEFISSDPAVLITPIHIYAADKDYQLSSVNALPSRVFVTPIT